MAATLLFCLDALTKFAATHLLSSAPDVLSTRLVGPLNLQLVLNHGNIANSHNQPVGQSLLIHATMLLLLIATSRVLHSGRGAIAIGLTIGGLFGNWMNLLVGRHAIVDFLGLGNWRVINLADIGVVLGVVLIAVELIPVLVGNYQRARAARVFR
jgi:lipoprotein signal peptidase